MVATNFLEVDVGMFGAEALGSREMQVQQLKGMWAANGRVGAWSRGHTGWHPPFPANKPREGMSHLQHEDRDGDRDGHGQE